MRSRQRRLRPAGLAVGATLTIATVAGGALAARPAGAQNDTVLHLSANHLAPGGHLTVTGSTSATAAGEPVVLQFAPSGATSWRAIAHGNVTRTGAFRMLAKLSQSGRLRVTGTQSARSADTSGGAATGSSTSTTTTTTPSGSDASIAPSQARAISVGSLIRVGSYRKDLLAGQGVRVFGSLLPGRAGRRVLLETRRGGRWHAVAASRTGGRGGFQLRYRASSLGGHALRVSFAGDRSNTSARRPAGQVTVYGETLASWYEDGGATACGFHAGMGVANKYLPCGTKVRLRYHGRTVNAVVDDRGPYSGDREFDLNQDVAAALGFDGVDTVWSTRT